MTHTRRGTTANEFVAMSEIGVPLAGRDDLMAAFADRLGAVDAWPGFHALEIWDDPRDPTTMLMVSWWDDQSSFDAYMRSDDHRRSHARIPGGEHRPRARSFRRYEVIAR